MRLAFTRWGLAPAAFWTMTPRELAAALGLGSGPAGFDRAALDRLMRRYPDTELSHGH
jgi:uncharacterized phage protein (TIGR02216 family)